MIGAKRKRQDESSDEESMEEKQFGNADLMALFESGEEQEYLPLPANRETSDQMTNVVEFEELIVNNERIGYIRCKSKSCDSSF